MHQATLASPSAIAATTCAWIAGLSSAPPAERGTTVQNMRASCSASSTSGVMVLFWSISGAAASRRGFNARARSTHFPRGLPAIQILLSRSLLVHWTLPSIHAFSRARRCSFKFIRHKRDRQYILQVSSAAAAELNAHMAVLAASRSSTLMAK